MQYKIGLVWIISFSL